MEIPKALSSSVDPQKLGLTVKGILVGAIPVILLVANLTNLDLGQDNLNAIIDGIVSIVVAGSTIISSVMLVWGLVRKTLVKTGAITPKK